MSKPKRSCSNCKNMMICELRRKIADDIGFGFQRQIISPSENPEKGVKGAACEVYEVIGKACFYYVPYSKEDE